MKQQLKSVMISSAGNLLEWYDFGLFSAFSVLFAHLFFPNTKPSIALIQVLGIYASGFLFRPLGAFIFGYLGDRFGRVKTLRLSICFMSLPTFLIAFVPTYVSIGIFAPLLLVCLRMLQGISLGGEFTGIIVYLAELAPAKRRGFYVSLVGVFTTLGFLTSSIVILLLRHFLTATALAIYGWRMAFAIGALLGVVVLYLQRKLPESAAFTQMKTKKCAGQPIVTLFKQAKAKMFLALSLVIFDAVFYYVCFVYMRNLLLQMHLKPEFVDQLEILPFILMLVLVPFFGWLCDKIGRRNSFLIISGSLLGLSLPCFKVLESGNAYLIMLALGIFTIISSFEQAATSITVVEQFPAKIRYSGVAISYSITQAIFGGTAPMLSAWLIFITKNILAPAYYVMLISLITFMSSYFFLKDTRTIDLNE